MENTTEFFKPFIDEVNEKEKNKPKQEPVEFSLENNPAFNADFAKKQLIENSDKLSDRQLYDLLAKSYSLLLHDINMNNDLEYLYIFTNSRILNVLMQLVSNIQLVGHDQIFMNRLIYDYIISSNADSYIKQQLVSISKIVNRNIIPGLLGLGIGEELASYLALASRRSINQEVNIKSVNHFIISSDPNMMTEQMIIYIYEKLFDSLKDLFTYTMLDVYTEEDLDNIGDGASDIYSNMTLAIIDLLNLQPEGLIRNVLQNYAGTYNLATVKYNYRISIQSLAVSEYKRILDVADSLQYLDNVYVP